MIDSTPIMVGLSGGVDSAVSLYLLKEQGYPVEGVFMKNWEETGDHTACTVEEDLKDAEAVARHLQVPFHVVNFSEQYWQRVFTHFLEEHLAGHTPNPDILCNQEIKFKALLQYIQQQGATRLATGHYAQLKKNETGLHLLKARDPNKDQSYFLHTLTQAQLKYTVFPIGHLLKTEVRAIAKKIGLHNHNKKDSTGICFIGERSFKKFLSEYLPKKPGLIETLQGEVLGEHDGLMFYTIGQRKNLHLGGQKNKPELPWYVINKDIHRNVLIVAQGTTHTALFRKDLVTTHIHWIQEQPTLPSTLFAKIRYRQHDQACILEASDAQHYRVTFTQPQRAITPGQSVVFYQGEHCLGGGVIEQ